MAQYDIIVLQKTAANKWEEKIIAPGASEYLGFNAGKVLVSKTVPAAAPAAHATTHLASGTDALAWTSIHAIGLDAAKPAAGATNTGYLYFSTDIAGGTLYRSNGATWAILGIGLTTYSALVGRLIANGTTVTAVKENLSAVTAPSSTDDSASGYGAGSPWVNTVTDSIYFCTDATVGAAVWQEARSASTLSLTVATATPYTPADTVTLLESNMTVASAVTINLLSLASYSTGATIGIKDAKGDANANNITINAAGGETIDGAASLVININYGFVQLYKSTSTKWLSK